MQIEIELSNKPALMTTDLLNVWKCWMFLSHTEHEKRKKMDFD